MVLSSVVPTARVVAEAPEVKSETLLNCSVERELSWAFSAVDSEL